jgi:hypothetical protein
VDVKLRYVNEAGGKIAAVKPGMRPITVGPRRSHVSSGFALRLQRRRTEYDATNNF